VSHGGAIQASRLSIVNNGYVLFEGNYAEQYPSVYEQFQGGRLSSIYAGSLTLSAREGGMIEFRDPILAGSACLNGIYTNEDGVTFAQTGDILFTGKYLSETLSKIPGSSTWTKEKSLKFMASSTDLYDGRLRIEDGVILASRTGSCSVTVHSSVSRMSTPTLRLKDGQIVGPVTVEANAVLELVGLNTASSITMQDGSFLNIYVGAGHMSKSALTLGSGVSGGTTRLKFEGALNINLLTEENPLAIGKYRLLTLLTGEIPSNWSADQVVVNGLRVTFDDLVWEGSTLYLNYSPDLVEATWTNESGNGLWDMESVNWVQDGLNYAYLDGVEVVFGDAGAGEVILAGELAPSSVLVENSAGQDYVWVADAGKGGRLTGVMSLTKRGEGVLSISSDHDYTGGTLVAGGTVEARAAGALGQGMVTLEGGTLRVAADGVSNVILSQGTSCLEVADGHMLGLKAALLNSGTLTLRGTFDVSALTPCAIEGSSSYVDAELRVSTSGFATSGGFSVTVIAGGTVQGDEAVITYGGIR